jgi:hypothetical protein
MATSVQVVDANFVPIAAYRDGGLQFQNVYPPDQVTTAAFLTHLGSEIDGRNATEIAYAFENLGGQVAKVKVQGSVDNVLFFDVSPGTNVAAGGNLSLIVVPPDNDYRFYRAQIMHPGMTLTTVRTRGVAKGPG